MKDWTLEDIIIAICGGMLTLSLLTLIGCLCYALLMMAKCGGQG